MLLMLLVLVLLVLLVLEPLSPPQPQPPQPIPPSLLLPHSLQHPWKCPPLLSPQVMVLLLLLLMLLMMLLLSFTPKPLPPLSSRAFSAHTAPPRLKTISST